MIGFMGSLGWTSFCENGHIVEICGHHEIIFDELKICPHCKVPIIIVETEWPDPDYSPFYIPEIPIDEDEISILKIYKNKLINETYIVKVYDVSLVKLRNKILKDNKFAILNLSHENENIRELCKNILTNES